MSDPGAGSPFDRGLTQHADSSIWNDRSNQPNTYFASSSGASPSAHASSTTSAHSSFLSTVNSHTHSVSPTGSQSVSPLFSPQGNSPGTVRSRSRAGTLPSRLSPGLIGTRHGLTNMTDNRPSPIGSPSVGVIGNNGQSSSIPKLYGLHVPQLQQSSSQQSQQQKSDLFTEDLPIARSNSSASVATMPVGIGAATSAKVASTASPSSRLRSGSLNMLSDPQPSFSPFGSIWSSSSNSLSTRAAGESSTQQHSTPEDLYERRKSQNYQDTLNATASVSSLVDPDPMQPFLQELSNRTDVSRLRSYTVNTLPYPVTDEEADKIYAQQQYEKQQMRQRQMLAQMHQNQHQQYVSSQSLFPMANRSRAVTVSTGGSGDIQLNRSPISAMRANEQFVVEENINAQPLRTLFVSNVPTDSWYGLQNLFSSYGQLESIRGLSRKDCALVSYSNIESAVQAKNHLDGKEAFTGMGPSRVWFAKIVQGNDQDNLFDVSATGGNSTRNSHSPPQDQFMLNALPKQTVKIFDLSEISDELLSILESIGSPGKTNDLSAELLSRAKRHHGFATEIGAPPEPKANRVYDAPALRDIRKKIDTGSYTQSEIEDVAIDLLDDIAALSSDYVGNTVVQKLFDACSEPVKDMMLEKIAPYLPQIGIHKNGTWAAQKIIDVCKTRRQTNMIVEALMSYTPMLFLDQFGNYVIQCCLKFEDNWNDFIFESILARFWMVCQGRFGARAVRACLESPHATSEQKAIVSAAIIEYSPSLAMNSNGSLLLTWLLDSSTFPNRQKLLASKLANHMILLCTHKLASLSILKLLGQRDLLEDSSARKIIYDHLFGNNNVSKNNLEQIIADNVHGPAFLSKVVSTSALLDASEWQHAVNEIRNILTGRMLDISQAHKRLMEDVGLTTWSDVQQPVENNIINMKNSSASPNKSRKQGRKPAGLPGQQRHMAYPSDAKQSLGAQFEQMSLNNSSDSRTYRGPISSTTSSIFSPEGQQYSNRGSYFSGNSQPNLSSQNQAYFSTQEYEQIPSVLE